MKYLTRHKKIIMSMAIILVMTLAFAAVMPAVSVSADNDYEYYIQVNKGTNVVTVFKADGTPYVAFTASCGGATPTGTFYTQNQYRWWELMGPSYGQYCTRITKSILFHSVWYYKKEANTQSYTQYNKLGNTASHGCVRLTTAASKWIYDNCPIGTKVTIIDGTEKDDVLGKPKTVSIDTSVKGYRGWDPTDPDPDNPYPSGSAKPEIKVESTTIQCGTGFSAKNLTVIDSCGFDITDSKTVKIKGNVNTNKLGTYKVEISVIDSCGRTAQKTVTYKVVDKKKYTILLNNDKLYKVVNSTRDLRKGMQAFSTAGVDVTHSVCIYVKAPSSSEFKKVNSLQVSNYIFREVGTYKVLYSITNPNNKLEKKVKQTIVVADSRPVIESDDNWAKIEINSNNVFWYNLMDGVTASSVGTKEDLTDSVHIEVYSGSVYYTYLDKGLKVRIADGEYTLKYTCEKDGKGVTCSRKLSVLGGTN